MLALCQSLRYAFWYIVLPIALGTPAWTTVTLTVWEKEWRFRKVIFLKQVFQQQHCCLLGSDTQFFGVVVDLCFVGCLAASWCSTHWLQVAPPCCNSHQWLQMLPNAPPRAQSLPTENHWLNISLVTGRGGLWNRCVTPRARPSFLVTPATFRRMKKQGRGLMPWRSVLLVPSKESQWGPQKTCGCLARLITCHLLQPAFLKNVVI